MHEQEAPAIRAAIDKVALGCRILGGEGFSRGAFGHVSARLDDGRIAIKSRGPDEEGVEFATAEDIILIDAEGALLAAHTGRSVPQEAQIHLGVYRRRPDVRSVVHIHPAEVVALRAAGRPLLPIYGAYDPYGLRLALATRVFPRSLLISTRALGDELAATLGEAPACLLDGHGIVTAGSSVEEAVLDALALGELARVNAMAAQLGTPAPIAAADIEAFRPLLEGTRRPAGRTDTGEPAAWHYYARRDAIRTGLAALATGTRTP